jgi:hypothetical protein
MPRGRRPGKDRVNKFLLNRLLAVLEEDDKDQAETIRAFVRQNQWEPERFWLAVIEQANFVISQQRLRENPESTWVVDKASGHQYRVLISEVPNLLRTGQISLLSSPKEDR